MISTRVAAVILLDLESVSTTPVNDIFCGSIRGILRTSRKSVANCLFYPEPSLYNTLIRGHYGLSIYFTTPDVKLKGQANPVEAITVDVSPLNDWT